MTTLIKCQPQHLQCGDTLVVRKQPYTVITIDGPDRIGTFDIGLIDKLGNKYTEIVIDTVTIEV